MGKRSRPRKPFEQENSEGSDCEDEPVTTDPECATFALGWGVIHAFQKSTAWNRLEQQREKEEKESKKRVYNNANRMAKAKAAGNYQAKGQVFQKRGMDPERLRKLLSKFESCKCFLIAPKLNLCCTVHSMKLLSIDLLGFLKGLVWFRCEP